MVTHISNFIPVLWIFLSLRLSQVLDLDFYLKRELSILLCSILKHCTIFVGWFHSMLSYGLDIYSSNTYTMKSLLSFFICLFLLPYVGNMKGKQWNGKHPPKKNREGKEKKEWEEEWSRVYSLQCLCPYYPFCLDHFSAYYCLLVILLVSFFFLYSTVFIHT